MKLGLISGLLLIMLLAGQAQASDEPAELKEEEIDISDILENRTVYEGEMVVVEGEIELECSAGCWFILNDKTGSILVDILPNNFAIPQESGEDARVYGEVILKDGEPQIIGKMVKIGGEVYR